MQIKPYTKDRLQAWDEFVRDSKNGTFLFYRNYMEYHQDRFDDHSLMFYDDDTLLALFPANRRDGKLDSHGGLTYGGFVTDKTMKTPKMLDLFKALIDYAREAGFQQIRYKSIPHIYHRSPAEEDLYALHLIGAELISRNVITAVNMQQQIPFQNRRKRGAKKARKAGIEVGFSEDLAAYWQILHNVLATVHDAEPVHSLEEISYLQEQFPEHIKLFAAHQAGEIIAGVLIYEMTHLARSQYIASNLAGRDIGALDLIFETLLNDVYSDKSYFEFGTSEAANTPNYLNAGLIEQKEGFGARAIMQDIYQIDLTKARVNKLHEALQ